MGCGVLSILAHCASTPLRAVLGLSGTLMGMVTLTAQIDPTRRVQLLFPIPGLNLSLSQISDANIIANVGGLLLVSKMGRLKLGLHRFLRFGRYNYRQEARQMQQSSEKQGPVAWVSHCTGIGLGMAYYHYLHSYKGLWPGNFSFAKTHSYDYIREDWLKTRYSIEDFLSRTGMSRGYQY